MKQGGKSRVFAVSLASRCECLYTWVAIDIQNRHLGEAAMLSFGNNYRAFSLRLMLATMRAGGGEGGRIILRRSGSEN